MISKKMTIINKLGLHARAAAKFVSVAGNFASQIKITSNSRTVDGKSIMSVMLLAAHQGTDIMVSAEGADEQEAIQAIEALILNRFDEHE